MVAMTDYRVSLVAQRCIRRRRRILSLHMRGHELIELAELVRLYLRCRHELRLTTQRRMDVSMACFNLNAYGKADALSLFRFEPADIGKLADALAVREASSRRRYRVSPEEALCVVLRRLSSPCRWRDLELLFGRSSSALSEIFFETVEDLIERWGPCVTSWRGDLMQDRAADYARCVSDRGAPHTKVVGFIDGTTIRVARPGRGLQRCMYSGHKRDHVMKFQSVVTPDGLLFHLYGPVEGRRHDLTMYNESGMDEVLSHSLLIGEHQYCLYGDRAYMLRPWMQVAYTGTVTEEQEAYNAAMNALRIVVEWGYKDLKQVFSALDYKRKLKVREWPCGLVYQVAVLLWNVRCCLYGSQASQFFQCDPLSLEQYLHV